MKTKIFLGVVLGLTALSSFADTNLLQNGDFELSSEGHAFGIRAPEADNVTGWQFGTTGSTVSAAYFDNATATSTGTGPGNVDYPPYITLPSSYDNVSSVAGNSLQPVAVQADPNGGYFVALDGQTTPGESTFVSQVVTGLTVGAKYDLTFDWAGVQLQQFTGPTTEAMRVSFGSQVFTTPVVSEGTHYFSGWFTQTYTFVAENATEALYFLAVGAPAGSPPHTLLDGVSLVRQRPVVSPVPEPATWLLMALGMGALGMLRLKRNPR